MITDVEMRVIQGLIDKCDDKISKKILGVAQEMLGALDAHEFVSKDAEADFIKEYASEIDGIVGVAVENNDVRKRMIGDYEVLCTFKYGGKEIFMGENPKAENEIERYIIGECTVNELFVRYDRCMCGDDYNEIAELYSQRISEQVQNVKDKLAKFPYDRSVISAEACNSITDVNLEGEIIVIKPEAIKREYVGADTQLCVAQSGFGCHPEAGHKKVFCKNIFTGEDVTWYRGDVLGTIKPECIPEWVKDRMTDKPIEVLFTFGSSEQFPFQWGYVSITAPSVEMAIEEFRRNYPDVREDTVNCSDWYYKAESVAKIKEHGNGAGCHRSIDITLQTKGKTVDELINKATRTSEEANKGVASKDNVEIEKE